MAKRKTITERKVKIRRDEDHDLFRSGYRRMKSRKKKEIKIGW
jgi:hypothetical protein